MKAAAWVLSLALALPSAGAHAGRSCESKPIGMESIQRAMLLAQHTATQLDQSGAQAVVLARRGQNLDEYGLRYSHLGLAYRDESASPDGGPARPGPCGASCTS